MTYTFDVKEMKPKHRSWNVRLIPAKLEELARAGTYYDSHIL
jgi:hypothetical protein